MLNTQFLSATNVVCKYGLIHALPLVFTFFQTEKSESPKQGRCEMACSFPLPAKALQLNSILVSSDHSNFSQSFSESFRY